ncbi:MAG: UDP-galactopyranose mutase [Spirochaetales bacterium]|nr:UDP-galactopyranose mutase [Spirochaetales bacterium]
MKYDYLIVGAGLFGSVFAREMLKKNKTCLVIDKRSHFGGNCYTEKIEDINVHKYGAHIFHTSNKAVWEYVNQFANFNNYINSPIARYHNEIYNLPFNMNTFSKMWGVITPDEAKAKIESQKNTSIKEPQNLEEQAISLVGIDIYEKLIKHYTKKQWGRAPKELPAFIIKRLPLRFTYNNNYFNDTYQGIPVGGYSLLFENLLKGIDVQLNTDYFNNKPYFDDIAKKIIYTGPVDRYFDYCYGELEYRSLSFQTEILELENYQGNAVVNYTDDTVDFTRIIEHKHFEFGKQKKTVITKEFPKEWNTGDEPYYPVNNEKNTILLDKYTKLKEKEKNVYFGGRLAEYKYYDMHQVVENALNFAKKEELKL